MLFKDGTMPIPGENWTSDHKSQPWHQPPRYANLTDALDKLSVKLTQPDVARHLLAFAEAGFPLVRISQMLIIEGLSQGWWTLDMGLLMAGPITKIIEIMCDSMEIDYDIGIDNNETWNTGNFYKAITIMNQQSGNVPNVGQVVSQAMPQIDQAAQDQQGSDASGAGQTADPNADSAGSQDLGMQGLSAMNSGDPKNPTGGGK